MINEKNCDEGEVWSMKIKCEKIRRYKGIKEDGGRKNDEGKSDRGVKKERYEAMEEDNGSS